MAITLPDVVQRVVLDTKNFTFNAKAMSGVTNKAGQDAEKLAASQDKATKSVKGTGDASDETRTKMDRLGDTVKTTGPKVLKLADHFVKARLGIGQTGKAAGAANGPIGRLASTVGGAAKAAVFFAIKFAAIGTVLLSLIPLAAGLGGGLLSLASSLTRVAGLLPAIAVGFGALASGMGVALLLFKGVGDAMKSQDKAATATVNTSKKVADAQKAGASAVAAAQKRVYDSLRSVGDANQRLTDTNGKLKYAQDKLTLSYEEARDALRDLREETQRSGLSQERAEINLVKARENLTKVNRDYTSTALERREAQLDVKDAELDLLDAQELNAKMQKDLADSEKKGIDNSDIVTAARSDVADAQRDQADASRDLQDALYDLVEAQKAVGEAQVEMVENIAAAGDTASGGALDAKAPTKAMLPLIAAIRELKKEAEPLMEKGRAALFPGAISALGSIQRLIGRLQDNFFETARIVGDLFGGLGSMLDVLSPKLGEIWTTNNLFLDSMNDIATTALDALVMIGDASQPIIAIFTEMNGEFTRWLQSVIGAEDFTQRTTDLFVRAFISAEKWWHIIRDVTAGLFNILKAAVGPGDEFADSLERGAASFRDWSNDDSTQGKLIGFFERSVDLTKTIGRLVGDIAGALFNISGGPGLAGINEMLTTLEGSTGWQKFLDGITGWGTVGLEAVADTVDQIIKLINGQDADLPDWMVTVTEIFEKLGDMDVKPIQVTLDVVNDFFGAIGWAEEHLPFFDKIVEGVAVLAAVKMVAGKTGILGVVTSASSIYNYLSGFNSKGIVKELKNINDAMCGENCAGGGIAKKLDDGGDAAKRNKGDFDNLDDSLGGTDDKFQGLATTVDKQPGKFGKLGAALRNNVTLMAGAGGAAYALGSVVGGNLGKNISNAGIALTGLAGAIEVYNVASDAMKGKTIAATAAKVKDVIVEKGRLVVTKLAAAGQWLLNAAMSANPILLIVAAVAALAAGIFILYKKNEGFRKFIDGIWQGIQAMWDIVFPILRDIVMWIADKIIAYIKLWATIWITYIKIIATIARWLWDHVLFPVFEFIWHYIQDYLIPGFGMFKDTTLDVAKAVGDAAYWLWEHVLSPVFGFMYDFLVGPLVDGFNALWDVVSTVFDFIGDKISSKWDTVKGIFTTIMGFLKDHFQKQWSDMGDAIALVWGNIGDVIGGAIDGAMNTLRSGLKIAGDLISNVLGLLASVASAVKLGSLAETLLRASSSANSWGEAPVPTVNTRNVDGNRGRALAAGGLIPFANAPTSGVGAGFKTGTPRAIVGEGSRHPEYVIPTDPKYRNRAMDLVGDLMRDMRGNARHMASGGRIPGTGDWFGDRTEDLKNLGRKVPNNMFDQIRDIGAAAVDKLVPTIPGAGNDLLGMVPAGGNLLRQAAIDLIKGEVDAQAAAMGTGSWRAIVSALQAANIPHKVISSDRPGARTHAGNNVSLHSLGRAVDLQGPGGGSDVKGGMRIFDFLGGSFRSALSELIYSHAPYYLSRGGIQKPIGQLNSVTKGDHWDHVHAGVNEGVGGAAAGATGGGGANRSIGRAILESMGMGSQWNALDQLWTHESGWNNNAKNPNSTAFGIAQFLNGTWAGTGYQKTSDPATQIRAGLKYIQQSYGDPNRAWDFWQRHHWYGQGGQIDPVPLARGGIVTGETISRIGEMGRPEAVIPLESPRGRAAMSGLGTNITIEAGAVRVTVGENVSMAEVTKAVEKGIDNALESVISGLDGRPL